MIRLVKIAPFQVLVLVLVGILVEKASLASPVDVSSSKASGSEEVASIPSLEKLSVDWASFLAQHDLVWEQFPPSWNTGGFTGNGQLGMVIYAKVDDNRIDFQLGRVDVTDHRNAPDRKTSFGVNGASVKTDYPRLDIGRMVLRPAGKIISGTMRQDLWNAEVTGTVVTDLGEVRFRAITLHDRMVDLIDVTSTEKANGRDMPWKWELLPGKAVAPRLFVFPKEPWVKGYVPNPAPQVIQLDGVDVCQQSLLAGGDYATAWQEKSSANKQQATLYVSIANEIPEAGKSGPLAVQTVKNAVSQPLEDLVEAHRHWWHAYYPASFISIPDGRLESLYWIQLYKFASACREDGPLLDDDGPFFRVNQWPYATWNLNVQLTYWLPLASNHLELEKSLVRAIDQYYNAMLTQQSQGPGIGNLTWALHNLWWYFTYAGDTAGLQADWSPKAIRLADCYLKRLQIGDDGKLHLHATESPEYAATVGTVRVSTFDDSNYNLALLRWLLNTLLVVSPDAPQAANWKKTLVDLTPLVTGPDGLMIGKGQPLDYSHRHYSHLLSLYPLFQLNPDDPADRDLATRSLEHWFNLDNGKMLTGFSFSGAASLYAALGRGEDADARLQRFFQGPVGTAYMSQNTFYFESGGKNPTIETPLSAASATLDLLLQSWGGKLRIFPATPSTWKEASFYDLRGQGGFLVSAHREAGHTAWVAVKSLVGTTCCLKVADWNGPVQSRGSRNNAVKSSSNGEYEIDLRAGEEVLLTPINSKLTEIPEIKPIQHSADEINRFGVKKGEQVPANQFWPENLPPGLSSPASN